MSFSIDSFEIFSVFKVKLNIFPNTLKTQIRERKKCNNVGSLAGEEYIRANSNQVP